MSRFAIRLLTLAAFSMALATAPVITSVYAAPDNDAPAPSTSKKKKKTSEAAPGSEAPGSEYAAFANGYRAAYATIYDRHDYAAAIAQLQTLAGPVGTEFFPSHVGEQPLAIADAALDWARKHSCDVVIIDTAGRLAIDEAMMREIAQLHAATKPIETLFVVDAMQGQDAVNSA